jgi:hypothetical protein
MRGGENDTDDELTVSTDSLSENQVLFNLGFEENEIEMLLDLDIPIDVVKREYMSALTSDDENGYGLVQFQNIPIKDIINANELRHLVPNTRVTKHDIANMVIRNVQPSELIMDESLINEEEERPIKRQRKN